MLKHSIFQSGQMLVTPSSNYKMCVTIVSPYFLNSPWRLFVGKRLNGQPFHKLSICHNSQRFSFLVTMQKYEPNYMVSY